MQEKKEKCCPGRPRLKRKVCFCPDFSIFKPNDTKKIKEVELSAEEIEAMRLKDVEGCSQTEGAKRMETSQSTFQRILTQARKKVGKAIVEGRILKVNKK